MPGQCMTIQAMVLDCWRKDHEDNQQKESNQSAFTSRRSGTAKSGQGSSQNRPDAWHADLRLGERQGRGEETMMGKVSEPQSPITQ